jgi:hypothetical protein
MGRETARGHGGFLFGIRARQLFPDRQMGIVL